jgi:hypothetical protein
MLPQKNRWFLKVFRVLLESWYTTSFIKVRASNGNWTQFQARLTHGKIPVISIFLKAQAVLPENRITPVFYLGKRGGRFLFFAAFSRLS